MEAEDCSEFWLSLHSAELQLKKLEKEALARREAFWQQLESFCLEHLSGSELDLDDVADVKYREELLEGPRLRDEPSTCHFSM